MSAAGWRRHTMLVETSQCSYEADLKTTFVGQRDLQRDYTTGLSDWWLWSKKRDDQIKTQTWIRGGKWISKIREHLDKIRKQIKYKQKKPAFHPSWTMKTIMRLKKRDGSWDRYQRDHWRGRADRPTTEGRPKMLGHRRAVLGRQISRLRRWDGGRALGRCYPCLSAHCFHNK